MPSVTINYKPGMVSTTDIEYYFRNSVQLSRDEMKRSKAIVMPHVEKLLNHINRADPRFSTQTEKMGSYWQGLKVGLPDEYDLNVPLVGVGEMKWCTLPPAMYGFNRDPVPTHEEDTRQERMVGDSLETVPQDLKVVVKTVSLPDAPKGYARVNLGNPISFRQDVTGRNLWMRPEIDFLMQGDIIPFLVRKQFRTLLIDAVRDLNLRKIITVSKKVHGPAITITIQDPRLPLSVSVDFAPMIQARLAFHDSYQWPKAGKSWPGQEKIDRIKQIGCSEVAKKPFYWLVSFAQAEKELMKGIDIDGGCRKKIHRIMKKLNQDVWCPTSKPVLSSYCLKNILLLECERHPHPWEWSQDKIVERFVGLTIRLQEAVQKAQLSQYFRPDINLLEGKDREELDLVSRNISCFLENSSVYLTATNKN